MKTVAEPILAPELWCIATVRTAWVKVVIKIDQKHTIPEMASEWRAGARFSEAPI